MKKPLTIDEYITGFPPEVQYPLQEIRAAIKKLVPDATEAIKYEMPTFVWKGKNLVHFAAFKKHIGIYGVPTGDPTFEKDLASYKQGKGSLQLPLDKAMPVKLILKIIRARMKNRTDKV